MRWREGDVVTSSLGYVWTCVVATPDDAGNTVWACKSHGRTRYIVVDWKPVAS